MQRFLVSVALAGLVLAPGSLPAAPAGGTTGSSGFATPPSMGSQKQRIERSTQESLTGQRDPDAAFQIGGRVYDGNGVPLSGVLVKMFTNGTLAAHARTDVDGAFSIAANPMSGGNNTTDLWFESPDPAKYLDSNVLLACGEVAREKNLFPRCTQKVEILGSFAEVEVTMMTPDERKESLAQTECLEK